MSELDLILSHPGRLKTSKELHPQRDISSLSALGEGSGQMGVLAAPSTLSSGNSASQETVFGVAEYSGLAMRAILKRTCLFGSSERCSVAGVL